MVGQGRSHFKLRVPGKVCACIFTYIYIYTYISSGLRNPTLLKLVVTNVLLLSLAGFD